LSKPLQLEDVDASSGILMLYYDFDTKVMFLAGKVFVVLSFYSYLNLLLFSGFWFLEVLSVADSLTVYVVSKFIHSLIYFNQTT